METKPQPAVSNEPLYHEKYRNQFHFSPKTGWMNDINGVWYAAGRYHLTYQADPDHRRCERTHWGHAVSADLLHWEQKEPVITPGRQSRGMAWSGTAVVDVNNTAGYGPGAVFLFFTDTERGQCMLYSTDAGEHFTEYPENPVIPPAGLDDPARLIRDQRDPKVFWNGETGQWVMMLFCDKVRRGDEQLRTMQFYTSADLKHWVRKQDFQNEKFYECPDVFPLPLDGNPEDVRWVFQSASTYYCLGRFDGERLAVEELPGEQLCHGPDIYAGQSFANMPDGRVVTMYWLDNWHGSTVPTSPWVNSASFPSELHLKTFPEGIRVTRSPIPEIAQLYLGEGERRYGRTASARVNPLAGLHARCFDLTVELDTRDTGVQEVLFDLMGKQYRYTFRDGTLRTWYEDKREGRIKTAAFACYPSGSRLKLRFLVDADCVEIFVNDGRRSYAEEYGFSGVSEMLSLTADGDLPVPYIEFHEIRSIW